MSAPRGLLAAIRFFDTISLWSGRITGWLIIPMVLSLVYEVVARYFFNAPTVWAYDMTSFLYGAFFMLGAAYTLLKKGHIRTDSFYAGWSPRTQGAVDTVCYVLFFFPGMIAFFVVSWDYFTVSFGRNERAVSSPWMPILWPLKLALTVAIGLLILQGISELLKSMWAMRTNAWLDQEQRG
jgi:TRAP-type mannitol/chloroaromatic compound transport system permease small subunit